MKLVPPIIAILVLYLYNSFAAFKIFFFIFQFNNLIAFKLLPTFDLEKIIFLLSILLLNSGIK